MRDRCTSNTGNVASQERDSSLLQSVETLLRLPQCLVYLRNRTLKRRELDHGIRDLSSPEWVQTFVKSTETLLCDDSTPAFSQSFGVGWDGGLHADFDGFEGTEEEVGDELCAGGGSEVDNGFRGVREQFLAILVFEEFVGTVLAGTLKRVANKGWSPACEDAYSMHLSEFGNHHRRTCAYIPRTPSCLRILPHAWKFPVYILLSTCLRHFTKSSGVTEVCVGPQAMIPPRVHAAKYVPLKSSMCCFELGVVVPPPPAALLFAVAIGYVGLSRSSCQTQGEEREVVAARLNN